MMLKKVNAYKAVLVFKNGAYSKVITNGTFWLNPFDQTYEYDLTKSFNAPCDLNILIKDKQLTAMLDVVEVKNNEIVLQYENDVFKTVLTAGRYAFWKGVVNYNFIKVDLSKAEITEDIDKMTLTHKEMLEYIRVYPVESYEKALMFVEGKFEKMLDPGLYYFWKNPTSISFSKADMRTQQLEISGQELLTRDKAALRINFYAQYKVTEIEKALLENKEYMNQVYVLLQLALREFIGTLTLDELLEKKEAASPYVLSAVKEKAAALGIELSACGIKDIILPGEVKEIMNQVLIAEKKAQANTIMRREETASTRSLLNTAKLMEDNEMLFKLKEMEYVEKIADKINSISVSGGTQVVEQLKQLFVPAKGK